MIPSLLTYNTTLLLTIPPASSLFGYIEWLITPNKTASWTGCQSMSCFGNCVTSLIKVTPALSVCSIDDLLCMICAWGHCQGKMILITRLTKSSFSHDDSSVSHVLSHYWLYIKLSIFHDITGTVKLDHDLVTLCQLLLIMYHHIYTIWRHWQVQNKSFILSHVSSLSWKQLY